MSNVDISNSEPLNNLFVRELAQILKAHGLELAALGERVGLDEATVARLQMALNNPLLSPVLNPDELDLLVRGLLLDTSEQGCLQAALRATELMHLLEDRLGSSYTRQITALVYPLLLTASKQAVQGTLDEQERASDHDSREDRTWTPIWEAMNFAALAMQKGQGRPAAVQIRGLREACAYLQEALDELDGLPASLKSLSVWRACHNKARKDLKAATRRLGQMEMK